MPDLSPSRKAAFDILMAVERGQAHSDDLLRGKAVNALPAADRNLATALVLGVLRWQIRLDRQLQGLLARPNARLDPEVRIALRLGAFQLLHMDRIPARAAIDESVELAKQAGHRFASGMVNAVLRKLAGAPDLNFAQGCHFSEETAAELALTQAHPEWMVERWAGFYGMEAARALCRNGQSQPQLTLRIHDLAVVDELAVGNHHNGLWRKLFKLCAKLSIVANLLRLRHQQSRSQSGLLHRRWLNDLLASHRPIWLRRHQRNLMARRNQCFERGHGEARCAAEDQSHSSTTRPRAASCESCADSDRASTRSS